MKGQSPFSKPMKIIEVLGNWTYRLSDGQKWNARMMRHYYSPPEYQTELELINEETPMHQPHWLRRSSRRNHGVPPERFINSKGDI
jgi:hypothetical protein